MVLCASFCWNMVSVTIRSNSVHSSNRRSSLDLHFPIPYLPKAENHLSCYLTILAIQRRSSRLKPTLFNNNRYTTNIHTDLHAATTTDIKQTCAIYIHLLHVVDVVVVDLPLLRVAVEGSDNLISLEKPCQASLPPDQHRHPSLGRHPKVQYAV